MSASTLPDLTSTLTQLPSGALLLSGDTVVLANPSLQHWSQQPLEILLSLPWQDWLIIPAERCTPLTPIAGKEPELLHTAILKASDGNELKVKVKHCLLDNHFHLLLIDRFEEDVTLTKAHSDFVSTVSHEFRTPLTSIKGFADTILRYGDNLPPDQMKRFIAIVKDQADRLTRLVENLLVASKLGAEKIEMAARPIPLMKLVDKLVQTIQAKNNPDRTFVLDIPKDLDPVWADPDRFEQVLLNLIDNAVKYSFDGTEVRVTARPLAEQADEVEILVKDQGVGIPAEHLPTIFTKFSRIENPLTRTVEGTGLGLYITKSLTLAQGGTIEASSQTEGADKGTTFRVIFPLATPERQQAFQHKTERAEGSEGIAVE